MLYLMLAIVVLALAAGVVLCVWHRAEPSHSILSRLDYASQIPRYRGGAGPARWTRKGH